MFPDRSRRAGARRERGFLVMAAVFLIGVVGLFVGYLATVSTVQQVTTIDDLQSARALQAARAGLEWGAYQVTRNGVACSPTSTTNLSFPAGSTLAAFTATVTCSASGALTEGAATEIVYRITSNACNSASCPNVGATSATYVDREVTVSLSRCTAGC